jgi:hypothetical protein
MSRLATRVAAQEAQLERPPIAVRQPFQYRGDAAGFLLQRKRYTGLT